MVLRTLVGTALVRALAAGSLVAALAACSTTLEGSPVSVYADPFKVAGMQAVDGPTGLREGIARNAREVQNTDGGRIDEIAAQSISDIEEFWAGAFNEAFEGDFRPVDAIVSWDADGYTGNFCGEFTAGLVNAAFCPVDSTIGWDRGVLFPALRNAHGDMALTMVLAHEYGHAVQRQARLTRRGMSTLVAEQQADCFAGAYMRWVAEDNSDRFTLSTGDGLNGLLVSMISFRDPLLTEEDISFGANADEHGSAFERISAFQFGFTDGPRACAAIDAKEVAQRRGDLPVALQHGETGEWAVTEESVRAFLDALAVRFPLQDPPTVSFDAAQADTCPDARSSPPVSYCPAANTITVDLPGLQEMGSPLGEDDAVAMLSGDNSAYSVLTSRYMVALQHEHGLELHSAEAGLRTACLTGAATTALTEGIDIAEGQGISLTAGDVDEAVAGLLTNGLAAGDVNGETVPAGFSRIDAFRTGVLGDEDVCLKRFP